MNSHQRLSKERITRKFSRNDAVSYNDLQGQTVFGIILSPQSVCETTKQWSYLVQDIASGKPLVLIETHLTSAPALNKGKYGGPARGGAAEKDIVASNYR